MMLRTCPGCQKPSGEATCRHCGLLIAGPTPGLTERTPSPGKGELMAAARHPMAGMFRYLSREMKAGRLQPGGRVVIEPAEVVATQTRRARMLRHFRLSLLPRFLSIVLLMLPLLSTESFIEFSLPDDYFVILRWIVFGTAVLVTLISYRAQRFGWCWATAMFAVLYNPLRPLHLEAGTWHWFNGLTAAFFAWSSFSILEPLADTGQNSGTANA